MTHYSKYFYGNEISTYGLENGFVDYRTLAEAFDAVLNNEIMSATDAAGLGYWEQIAGYIDYYDDIEEIRDKIAELDEEEDAEKIAELEEEIAELEEEQDNPPEVFQWYIVPDRAVEILEEAGEIVYRNDAIDVNLWGVTHWGTSWDYVLTDIKLELN